MKKSIISFIKLPDSIFSQIYLRFFQEKNSLIVFLFHGLFRNEKEISLNIVDPELYITIEHFRQFIEYYLNQDYTFISPNDILNGLNYNKKYIMITFDDGYYNNKYNLPILEKHQIPATFFISTNNVKHNKCFWWDVLYRERKKSNTSTGEISRERNQLKTKTSEEIEKYLIDIFGERAFKPISDIDRPFTPSELKDFSKEKYVFLGNHTSDHAILTNYPSSEIESQILIAQNTIQNIAGVTPIMISYPNGSYSDEVIRISKKNGIKLGVTVDPKKNYLPLDHQGDEYMRLGRFALVEGNAVVKQCQSFRSDIVLFRWILNLFAKRC